MQDKDVFQIETQQNIANQCENHARGKCDQRPSARKPERVSMSAVVSTLIQPDQIFLKGRCKSQ